MNVDFITAIKMFFANYANFKGRSTRAEYWWVMLFLFLVSCVLSFLGSVGSIISIIFSLAVLIPNLAIATRRLHDTGRSGWWLAIYYIVGCAFGVWMMLSIWPVYSAILTGANPAIAPDMAISMLKGMTFPGICLLALSIWFIVIMCKKSGPDNQYGPNPYGE